MTPKPRLWPVLVVAGLVLPLLVGLGVWQVQRLAWKTDLLARLDRRMAAPPLDLAAVTTGDGKDWAARGPGGWAGLAFRRLRLTGDYAPGPDLRLLNRTVDGVAGLHLVRPFRTGDGLVVLVDRGWVPLEQSGTDRSGTAPPPGRIQETGFVRLFQPAGRFIPDNDPESGDWFSMDRLQMAAATGQPDIAPFYLARAPGAGHTGHAGDTDHAGHAGAETPRPVRPASGLRNDHAHYAITWFSLAALFVIMLIVYWRHHVRSPAA